MIDDVSDLDLARWIAFRLTEAERALALPDQRELTLDQRIENSLAAAMSNPSAVDPSTYETIYQLRTQKEAINVE